MSCRNCVVAIRCLLIGIPLLISMVIYCLGTQTQEPPPLPKTEVDLQVQLEKSRSDSAFKKLQENAERLSQAARELKEMIDKSNKDTFSLQILKKTDEVEKILKEIRKSAKHGY